VSIQPTPILFEGMPSCVGEDCHVVGSIRQAQDMLLATTIILENRCTNAAALPQIDAPSEKLNSTERTYAPGFGRLDLGEL
jgi:hypothetical protein